MKKCSIEVIGETKLRDLKKFGINEIQRTEGYKEFKKKIQDFMLNILLERYPILKGRVEYCDLGTPLTYYNYLNRYSALGIEWNSKTYFDRNTFMKFDTPIKGLRLCGEDVGSIGVVFALYTGFIVTLKA